MKVKRLTAWLGTDRLVPAGEICEMPDDLAELHIAHGSAERVDMPAPVPAAPTIAPPSVEQRMFAADDEPLVIDDEPRAKPDGAKRKR